MYVPNGFSVVRVVPRNQRWEVAANGVTRPMIDWLCTRDRAIAHALELAHEVGDGHVRIRIERSDGTIEDELDVTELSMHAAAE
ncbi:MAG: hypothetical protein JWM74_805 [Myxococcaceae bacterium]|nr:hypothetical protein [Myxococcaceae bacterium]